MCLQTTRSFRRRSRIGSALTETGPALYLLLIVILFPLIDFLYMGMAFGIVWYLNHLEVRELAVRVPADTSQVLTDIDTEFVNLGFGKFVGLSTANIQHPMPGGATRTGVAPNVLVSCTTVATVNPFLNLPFIIPVAGINSPMTFNVTGSRLQEEFGAN